MSELTGKYVFVTGANRGIGKETARALAAMGASVAIHGRDREATEAAAREIRESTGCGAVGTLVADLSSMNEVRSLAAEYCDRYERLDVLVNNAGLIRDRREVTVDGHEYVFAVNHLAPFLLTSLLLENLLASAPSRIVTVSSRAHTRPDGLEFDDLMFERRKYVAFDVYGASKLANVLFTRELARRIAPARVTANCLHPGIVNTGFGADGDLHGILRFVVRTVMPFLTSPKKGARTSVYLAASPEVEGVTGEYFVDRRIRMPSAAALSDEDAVRLWEESERLCAAPPKDDPDR